MIQGWLSSGSGTVGSWAITVIPIYSGLNCHRTTGWVINLHNLTAKSATESLPSLLIVYALDFLSAITSPGKEPILERPKCETPVCLNGFSLRKKYLILMLLPYISPILYYFYYSALWYFWRTRHPINIHIFSLLPQQPSQVKKLLKLFQFQACDI